MKTIESNTELANQYTDVVNQKRELANQREVFEKEKAEFAVQKEQLAKEMKELANQKAAFAKVQEDLETQIIELSSQKEELLLTIQIQEKNHEVELSDRNDQTDEKKVFDKSNQESVRQTTFGPKMMRVPYL